MKKELQLKIVDKIVFFRDFYRLTSIYFYTKL